MRATISLRWIGIVCFIAGGSGLLGQVITTPSTQQPTAPSSTQAGSTNQSELQAFLQQRDVLMQQRRALIAGGATEEQLKVWYQQNSAQFASLQRQAQAMGTASALQPMVTNRQPSIPTNASQTMVAFLTTRASLTNARSQIHNRLVQSMSSSPTTDQISQMQEQEMQTFEEQHASDLQAQAQRAQTLANESAQIPLPVPRPLQLPLNMTPQMASYLTLRYQLRQERVQLWNQYVNADPTVREAAMQQWQQQNAGRIQQLQLQAQNLTQASSTTQN